jgi:hypothetical protein
MIIEPLKTCIKGANIQKNGTNLPQQPQENLTKVADRTA